jgi:hypothetical protein
MRTRTANADRTWSSGPDKQEILILILTAQAQKHAFLAANCGGVLTSHFLNIFRLL